MTRPKRLKKTLHNKQSHVDYGKKRHQHPPMSFANVLFPLALCRVISFYVVAFYIVSSCRAILSHYQNSGQLMTNTTSSPLPAVAQTRPKLTTRLIRHCRTTRVIRLHLLIQHIEHIKIQIQYLTATNRNVKIKTPI